MDIYKGCECGLLFCNWIKDEFVLMVWFES